MAKKEDTLKDLISISGCTCKFKTNTVIEVDPLCPVHGQKIMQEGILKLYQNQKKVDAKINRINRLTSLLFVLFFMGVFILTYNI